MRLISSSLAFVSLFILMPGHASALLLAGEAEEGAPVHEEYCVSCHKANFGGDGSAVYSRDPRMVNSIEGLMGQVGRCNQMTNAGLSSDQIDDLVAYLNETYYKFGE
jgi:mono/diheme cytochrome c family protein